MTSIKRMIKQAFGIAGLDVSLKSSPPLGQCWMADIATRTKIETPSMIFDVGANIGQTSVPLTKRFPNAQIHAFEPTKSAFEQLTLQSKPFANITPHHLGMGSTPGELTISTVPNSTTNSFRAVTDEQSESAETVVVGTVDIFCQEHQIDRIDIFKCDTEGFDIEVLKGASESIKNNVIRSIVIEITFDQTNENQSDFFAIHELLSSHGYTCAGFYSLQYLLRESPHGAFCDALFIHQSELVFQR